MTIPSAKNSENSDGVLARQGPAFRRAGPDSLKNVRNLVAVGRGKGGVGKSTVTTNLAMALHRLGASVAVLDADIYGPSQPGMLGSGGARAESFEDQLTPLVRHGVGFMSIGLVMPTDGPVVWRAPMATKVIYQFLNNVRWGDLDYLLIDLPPGTGDVQLSLAQQAPLTGSVVVTTPQQAALGVARKGLKMFQQVKVPILGVVENMSGFVCKNCGTSHLVFKKDGGETLAKESGVPFLGRIPLDADIMEGGDAGEPVSVQNPTSVSSLAFLALAKAFESEVARENGSGLSGEPKQVGVGAQGSLKIEWSDGHEGVVSGWTLRTQCPCAACVDEDTGQRILDPKKIPLDVTVSGTQPVGRYGASVAFSDGHSTGIYTWDRLRSLCECPLCTAQRAPAGNSFSV